MVSEQHHVAQHSGGPGNGKAGYKVTHSDDEGKHLTLRLEGTLCPRRSNSPGPVNSVS